ncbi:MAG TPA: HsdR family type I site-specific deoxyribonuclease [Pyrinomonadaceae bacterium]|jgi:type I restriction enzyme R subunit|nr:HsdR family type I site-specific deoxyribonuclease [Pyrinomonadaceae bacterium]
MADSRVTFLRLDEKNHVEEPFLKQLEAMPGLCWNVLRLEMGNAQAPQQTGREDFTQVLMPSELEEALKRINPWMNEQQIYEAVKDISTFEGDNLYKNNQRVLELLIKGTSVQKETEAGLQYEPVQYIDFDHLEKNSFIAVSQFKIRVLGTEHHIYPDIICFVNGLPVAVIECKSPRANDPIPSAIDQLMRYCEQRDYTKEGSKALFYYNQFIVATSRNKAKFGTITTTIEKLFYRWTDPFPFTLAELSDYCNPQKTYFVDAEGNDDDDIAPEARTSPNDQQRLVHGMLKPENLLSIIRTFSIWTTTDKGEMIRVVGRYQQFRAVKKTIERLRTGINRDDRGGIIWHTQGSGKSLTMVFLIREMYLYTHLQSYKIVLLTDRKQLDDQIRETAQSTGYTINDPKNISDLKTALANNNADIVSAMIHKFQEREYAATFPELNADQKILILTDEAHRSQYSKLGANLDRALPNATRIAFTGTPIERTEQTYGEYIDKYTMRQSIEDGVTLAIVYEGRTHDAEVKDVEGAEKKFQDVFKDYNLAEKAEMLAYGGKKSYMEAQETIRDKAKDMLRHYVEHILPNGYKAQVVSVSKDAAHRYRLALEAAIAGLIEELKSDNPYKIAIHDLERLKVAAVISDVDHNDKPELKEYSDSKARKAAIEGFKLPFGKTEEVTAAGNYTRDGNIGILVVVDMLLTGFDAPVEQVMYLDKVVVNHNLLQAIARVNRVYDENKHVGFVVDYVGMGNHLKRALDAYWEKEQEEITNCLLDNSELVAELKNAHEDLKKVFEDKGISMYSDADDIFNLFYDEDIRYAYMQAFERFSKALDNIFPRKEALDYLNDLNRFADINTQAQEHLRDARLSMKGVSDKLRKVTDEFLISKGIENKIEPISILDDKFFEHVKKRTQEKTKAAEIEHAIRHFIDLSMNEDPELYTSFAEELQRILLACRENWNEIYRQLEILRNRIKAAQTENTYGLDRRRQMPIFRKLHALIYEKKENLTDDEISNLTGWTKEIYGMLKVDLGQIGFWGSVASVNRLKGEIANFIALECHNIPAAFANRNVIAQEILSWANDDKTTTAILTAND